MKILIFLTFLFVAELALSAESDVLDLTDSDFESTIKEYPVVLAMFYAPWCGHCKKLKPEYAKAAELMRSDDPTVTFVKVDCTEGGKDTCSKFGVSGYPTLKIFRNGDDSAPQDYNGPREATGIVKYMRAQVGPSSKDLNSVEAYEKFLSVQEGAILGFFEKESDLKSVFIKYADLQREKLRFGHSSNPDVLEKAGEKNAIVLFRAPQLANKFEPSTVKFTGKDSSDLKDFVKKNFHGLVGVRTRDTMNDFQNPLVTAYYAVDYVKNTKGTNYWRNRVLKVAKEWEGKMNFAIAAKDEFQHELNEYGYDYVGDKPVILARDSANQKFVMKDEFSVDNLQAFVNDLYEGNLEPYIKSEAVPTDNDGPVTVVVAKNFNEVVPKDKDVLIEFYAPWCGHCKKLAPVFDELGEKLKGEDVVIAKMDATANDVPQGFDVRGFPTLFWLPKNGHDKPVRYDGGRELSDFISYISKHATKELKGYDRSGNERKTEL